MAKTGIIFDCDGTLVDTEYLCAVACTRAFAPYGVHYEPAQFMSTFLGRSHGAIIADLNQRHGVSIPVAESMKAYGAIARTLIPTDMKVFPASLELVRALAARDDVALAVASNGDREVVLYELECGGYLDLIGRENVLTACDVTNPKPAPDIYLAAAARIGVDPAHCIVVEDSPTGTRAGVAAGMRVVGYTGFSHDVQAAEKALAQAGAVKVINNLPDLAAWAA